jgi:hypothetical protein
VATRYDDNIEENEVLRVTPQTCNLAQLPDGFALRVDTFLGRGLRQPGIAPGVGSRLNRADYSLAPLVKLPELYFENGRKQDHSDNMFLAATGVSATCCGVYATGPRWATTTSDRHRRQSCQHRRIGSYLNGSVRSMWQRPVR